MTSTNDALREARITMTLDGLVSMLSKRCEDNDMALLSMWIELAEYTLNVLKEAEKEECIERHIDAWMEDQSSL